nr:S9 family peptidase [Tsukamurella sp. TY48]
MTVPQRHGFRWDVTATEGHAMTATTPTSTGRPRRIEVEEFFADPEFSGASISPDGNRIAYLAPKYGRTQVWVRGIDDDHDDAVCVTHDERRGIKTYYWTDDPRWLLYRQDTDGNEDWHIYRVDLDAPEEPALDLTPMAPGSRVVGAGMMRTEPGHLLVGMNPDPMVFGLYMIDVGTGATTLVREQPADSAAGTVFGRDTEERFFSRQADNGDHEFYAIDEATGERRLLLRLTGPEYPIGPYPMFPSADGEALIIGMFQDDADELRLIRIDRTGEQTVVAALPGRNLCTMGWATEDFGYPESVFLSRRTGEVIAARFVGDRPIIEPVDDHFAQVYAELSKLSDGVIDAVSSDDAEQRWVVSFLHDRDPGATYFYDHATGESRLLFRAHPSLDPADLAPMTAVHFTARDGLPLHGFLTLPVGVEPQRLPLVLLVHGGPWAHDLWRYSNEAQLLANRGYAVLQVNFRGSTGYGRRHITSAIKQLAGTMQDDLIDAAGWAVDQGYADPDRIAIFGGSYGGYATLVGVTFTPDYFAAAVDYVGVSSLLNFIGDLPPFVRPHLQNNWIAYAGDPEDPEQAADMRARSPIEKVDEIRTPLLVLQGANDVRVRQSESDAIVDSLRARGVPVEYFVAQDEGHHFTNPENLFTMYRLIDEHFDRHLRAGKGARITPSA